MQDITSPSKKAARAAFLLSRTTWGSDGRTFRALVALLAGCARFFAAELVSATAGMRRTATQAGDFTLLFRRHGGETAGTTFLGGDGFLHGLSKRN